MHPTYKAKILQYAVPPTRPTWGGQGGVDSARYYAPPTFISRDPMFEKYPNISPYTYCGNNPVMYIDPNGEEKVPWLDEKNSENNSLINGYKAHEDKNLNIINIFAHGNGNEGWANGLFAGVKGNFELYHIETFKERLSSISKVWKNKNENSKLTIIFHVCQLDKDGKTNKKGEKDDSFAKRLSNSEAFNDVVIVATSGDAWYGTYDDNGKFTEYSTEDWNVYYKGKLIGTYNSSESMENKNPREDFQEEIYKLDHPDE